MPKKGNKQSDFAKQKIADANRNRVWSAESRAKLSAAHKGKKISDETKKIWSQQRSGKGNHRYGKPAAHGKGQWYKRADGNVIWLRSKWEVKFADYLDECGYCWQYEPEAYSINYFYNNKLKTGTYRPDFKINCPNKIGFELLEIKGYWRDDAKSKFEAFRMQYPNIPIRLFEKKDLLNCGVLRKGE